MADDQNKRPYRADDPRGTAPSGGSDPLAELARLIGQTDPFAEYGREGAQRAAPPQQHAPEPVPEWSVPPAAPAHPAYAAPAFAQPPYAQSSPYAAGADLYRTDAAPAEYAAAPAQDEEFANDPYYQSRLNAGDDGDIYDDMPPSRRRMGIIAIAAIFALAVLGTAGAFGYRALFGSSGASVPPPVIKADTTPSKIVPATTGKDPQSSKLITDRLGNRGEGEKLVSREEQPIDPKDRPPGMAPEANPGTEQVAPAQPVLGSGVIGAEPKKVHTLVIRPDQPGTAEAAPLAAEALAPTASPTRVKSTTVPAPPPAPRAAMTPATEPEHAVMSVPPARASEPAPRPAVTRAAPPVAPVRRAAVEPRANANAPLSLDPEVEPAAPAPARPTRTAAVEPPTRLAPQTSAAAATGGYAVQLSSQRSEAEAQSAFRGMQAKYPNLLGGRAPLIHKVELGAKGTYYRAMVGPFPSSAAAGELCSSLKSAGGQCIVQKI
jgi:hypothetical protein